jgi:hypothetical protein
MRLSRPLTILLGLALTLMLAAPALANGNGNGKNKSAQVSFFTGGTAQAGWAKATPPPPGAGRGWSIRLWVNGQSPTDYGQYAGATLLRVPATLPASPPSFDFMADRSAASGGSPRLVIGFSDGGRAELRPLNWTAGIWVHEDGTSVDWDNNGGTCGFVYQTSYAIIQACHAGATVTAVYVVSDSGWLNQGGYTNYIANIRYGDILVTPQNGKHQHDHDDGEVDEEDDDDDD